MPDKDLLFTSSYHAFGAWARYSCPMPSQSWTATRTISFGVTLKKIPISIIYHCDLNPETAATRVTQDYRNINIGNAGTTFWMIGSEGTAWGAVVIRRFRDSITFTNRRGNPSGSGGLNSDLIPTGFLVAFVRQTWDD